MKKCLLMLFAVIFSASAVAYASDEAWEMYIDAHKKTQVAFHHEVRLSLHELKDLIALSQEMQLASADQKTARFYYLSEHEPARIIRSQGFLAFINFNWTDTDEEKLTESDKGYKKRKKKIDKIRQKLEKDPDFKKILEQLDKINGSMEYERIRNRFRFMPEEVEKLLNA